MKYRFSNFIKLGGRGIFRFANILGKIIPDIIGLCLLVIPVVFLTGVCLAFFGDVLFGDNPLSSIFSYGFLRIIFYSFLSIVLLMMSGPYREELEKRGNKN